MFTRWRRRPAHPYPLLAFDRFRQTSWKKRLRTRPALQRLESRTLLSFAAPVNYDTGTAPNSMVVADFNGDGIPDLVTGSSQTGSVSVLLANGDGTFRAAQDYPAGYQDGGAMVAGDFNGDGNLDVAIASYDGSGHFELSVLFGNGDGSFQPPRSQALPYNAFGLAAGDFNGDGKLDLAVCGFQFGQGGMVSVLLGNGDGSFQTAFSTMTGPSTATSVAAADFNSDGRLDLAVTKFGFPLEAPGVLILLGNGDGTFRTGQQYPLSNDGIAVVAADFNNDGRCDLATIDDNVGVSVFLGNGDGTFQTGQHIALSGASGLAVGDANGDGNLDLLVVAAEGTVLLGNGHGSFQIGGSFDFGGGGSGLNAATPVAVGDFNGDGNLDVVTAISGSDAVSVRLGNGDGTFQTTPRFDSPGAATDYLTDLNGDGIPDIVSVNPDQFINGNWVPGTLRVRLGNGDGTYQAPQIYDLDGLGNATVLVGDFNGDGLLDIVVGKAGRLIFPRQVLPGSVDVLLGNGDGTFQNAISSGPINVGSLVAGDYNGDGLLDLVALGTFPPSENSPNLIVLLGNGDGTFQAPQQTVLNIPVAPSLAAGDFNGDHNLDVAITDANRRMVDVLLGNGDGSFQAPTSYGLPDTPSFVTVGDVNSDGQADLVVTTTSGVSLLWGNGDGTFQNGPNYALSGHPSTLAVVDLNGDNIPDLAVEVASGVKVLLGNGDGTFQTSNISYGAFPGPGLSVVDFNGDGFLDVATGGGLLLLNAADWPASPGHPASLARRSPRPEGTPSDSRSVALITANGLGTTEVRAPLPSTPCTAPAATDLVGHGMSQMVVDGLCAQTDGGVVEPAWSGRVPAVDSKDRASIADLDGGVLLAVL
jgi:FG-GAP-like repeat